MFTWTCVFLVDISCMCYIMYYICSNVVLHTTETLPLNMFEMGCSQQYGEPHFEELTGKQIEMVNTDIKTSGLSSRWLGSINYMI